MRTIIKKVILVDAPPPPFMGTRLVIRISEGQKSFGINFGRLAEGHVAITVDWGDGATETVAAIGELEHAYASAGEYEVRISDDVSELAVASRSGESAFGEVYPKLVRRAYSNAQSLRTINARCFAGCENMTVADLGESSVGSQFSQSFANCRSLTTYRLPKGLIRLSSSVFMNCTSLSTVALPTGVAALQSQLFCGCTGLGGDVLLPCITAVNGNGTTGPFYGCTGITAFHFKRANEEAVRKSSGFAADPTLGTGIAVSVFDL